MSEDEKEQEEYKPGTNLDAFMAEKYSMDEKPADEKPADEKSVDEKPADEIPADEKPADEKPADSLLPPDFEPGKKTVEDEKEEVDIKLEDLDKAIEAETNPDKKLNMGRVRTKLERQGQELTNLTSTISALREAGVIDESNNVVKSTDPETQKKLDEAYDKISRLSLVEDPRFQAKYQEPIGQKLEQIAIIIKDQVESEDQARQLVRHASSLDPVKRMEYLDQHIPETMKVVVAAYFKDADDIVMERNTALQNHHQELERLKQEKTVDEQQRVTQYREAVKTKMMDEVIQEGFGIFTSKPGNEEYTNFLNQIMESVEATFDSNDPERQAKAMLLGTAAPVYRGMYEATQRKLDTVTAELEKLKSGLPGFRGGADGEGGAEPDKLPGDNAKLAAMIAGSETKFHQQES